MRRLIDTADIHAAFDRRLSRHTDAPLALALSGGGDSMALLHLAQGWARANGRRLIAFTVDHRLHPGSAAWTRFAGGAATALGAPWRSLDWTGDKPATGLPAAARVARHRLLADAAREAGASVILFAHTADDVAEGEVMRAADAPTLGRLHEWSPSPVWPQGRGVFAFRPLLNVRRANLRALLSGLGAGWLDDPANDDPRYARARARAALSSAFEPRPTATPPMNIETLQRLARGVEATADGRLILMRAALFALERGQARRFLTIAMVCAAGGVTPPRSDSVDRLLDRLAGATDLAVTLAGARIVADAATVTLAREAGDLKRAAPTSLHLRAGQIGVWDGRFEIVATADLVVEPVAGLAARLGKSDRASLNQWPAATRPGLPALIHGESVALPQPFCGGPAFARPLAAARLGAACGLVSHERDIFSDGMAQGRQSSYVEALALA